jgi:prolyl-tRNA synthetase
MFADAELIGIPHRLVLSDRHLDAGQVEYKGRRDSESSVIVQAQLMDFLKEKLSQ